MDDFQISKFIRTFFCFSFHSVGVMPSTLLNWCLKLDASLNPTIDPISLTVRSGYSIISFPASRIRSSFLTVRNGLPNLALQKYDSSLLVKPISMRGVSVDSVGSVYRRSRTHCSNAFAALAAEERFRDFSSRTRMAFFRGLLKSLCNNLFIVGR